VIYGEGDGSALRPVEFIQIAGHRLQMTGKGQIWETGEKSFKFLPFKIKDGSCINAECSLASKIYIQHRLSSGLKHTPFYAHLVNCGIFGAQLAVTLFSFLSKQK